MRIIISLLGLVQVALLLISVGFLWTTIVFYLTDRPGEFRTFGAGFLVVYAIFLVLFFGSMVKIWKEPTQERLEVNGKVGFVIDRVERAPEECSRLTPSSLHCHR